MRIADTLLLGSSLYDVYARLTINGDLVSDFAGYDPLISATWTPDAEQLAAQGTITIANTATDTFSPVAQVLPLGGARLRNVIPRAGKTFALETATVAKGAPPTGYQLVFDGKIDNATASSGGSVELTVRDGMAHFLDAKLEPTAVNGFAAGGAGMITTMAQLRDYAAAYNTELANLPIIGVGNPAWTVVDYWQEAMGMTVAEAIQRIVQQRGWQFRYGYFGVAVGGAYLAFDPVGIEGASYFVNPSQIIQIQRATSDGIDIRNALSLVWGDPRVTTSVTNPTSIGTYHRRFELFSEDKTSQIDTLGEANTMLNAALAQQSEPTIEVDYERLYFWPVELADHHLFESVFPLTSLDLTVVGYTHSITPKRMRSLIRTRGTAVSAARRLRKNVQRTTFVYLSMPSGIAPERGVWLTPDNLDFPP